jgi:hypothetical protein
MKNRFWEDVCMAIMTTCLLIAALILLFYRQEFCGTPKCPEPIVVPAHHFHGHAEYTEPQKAMWVVCDVAFAHYVPSGKAVLVQIHNECADVQDKAVAVGGHPKTDYVKSCVVHGVKTLAEYKQRDGKQFHDECVAYITKIFKNQTLLSFQEGAEGYANSGQFSGTNRPSIAPKAEQLALEQAKHDALLAKSAKYSLPLHVDFRGKRLDTMPLTVAFAASCVLAAVAVVGGGVRRRLTGNGRARQGVRNMLMSVPSDEQSTEC